MDFFKINKRDFMFIFSREKDCLQLGIFLNFLAFVVHYCFSFFQKIPPSKFIDFVAFAPPPRLFQPPCLLERWEYTFNYFFLHFTNMCPRIWLRAAKKIWSKFYFRFDYLDWNSIYNRFYDKRSNLFRTLSLSRFAT